jgi:hypothetical protein
VSQKVCNTNHSLFDDVKEREADRVRQREVKREQTNRHRWRTNLFNSQIKIADDLVSLPFATEANQVPQLEAERQTTSPVCP